jgi:lysophospholipase L1-like esterase
MNRILKVTLALLLTASPRALLAQVDFTRYVAIGDSLTAGFNSGGLVQDVQRNDYPALLFRAATGTSTGFEQPLVSRPGLPALLELRSLSPLIIAPRPGQGSPQNLQLQRPYNNLAVPGARIHDLLNTVHSDTNPLFDLVLRGLGTEVQQMVALHPSFVTVWIGNNDVLAAATSGRVIEGVTLTPVAQFDADFRAIMAAVASTGAKIAVGNIPDVASIPFVTTLPPIVVNPQTQQPVLINGQPVPLIGPSGPLRLGDRVLITASSELAKGNGLPPGIPGASGVPLSDAVTLTIEEQQTIGARVAAYNGIISSVANDRGAALFDANALLRRVATEGVDVGGVDYSASFLTGGVFSYDGVHPTAFGYAFVANEWIRAINDKHGSEIPPINLAPYVFGPEGAAGTQAENPPFAGDAFVWTAEADAGFRAGLGVPSEKELSRLAGKNKPGGKGKHKKGTPGGKPGHH